MAGVVPGVQNGGVMLTGLSALPGSTSVLTVSSAGVMDTTDVVAWGVTAELPAVADTRYGARFAWDNPITGQHLWPIRIEPITAEDMGGVLNDHGPFGIVVNLTKFGNTMDCSYAMGMFGDGVNSEINYTVRETSYDVTSQDDFRSHEIYDVVQHRNATHWPTSRRVGYTYVTYERGTGSGGVVLTDINSERFLCNSDYPNPNNPGIGAFGSYFSVIPDLALGGCDMSIISKVGTVTLGARATITQFATAKPFNFETTTMEGDGSLTGYTYLINGDVVHKRRRYVNTTYFGTAESADLGDRSEFNNIASDRTKVSYKWTNTGNNASIEIGISSPNWSWDPWSKANYGHIGTLNSSGLRIGNASNHPIEFYTYDGADVVTGLKVNGSGTVEMSKGTVLRSGSSDPTTSDIVSGSGSWWKNTTNGEIRYWVNDSNTMKKSAALT